MTTLIRKSGVNSVPKVKWMVRTESSRHKPWTKTEGWKRNQGWALGCPVRRHVMPSRFNAEAVAEKYKQIQVWNQGGERTHQAKQLPGGCAPARQGAASSSGLVAAAVASPSSMAVSLRATGKALPSTSMQRLSIRIYYFGLTLGRVSFGEDMPEDVLRGCRKATKHMKKVESFG